MSDVSDLLTVADAATLAGVSARTMRRWVTSGRVVSVQRGHVRYVAAAALSELVATNGHSGQAGGHNGHRDGQRGHGRRGRPPGRTCPRELTGRVSELSATAGMWQARALLLEERLRMLEAPKAGPDPAPNPIRSHSEEQPSSRWRRLWRWLAAD